MEKEDKIINEYSPNDNLHNDQRVLVRDTCILYQKERQKFATHPGL
jgi:hypothetical protein